MEMCRFVSPVPLGRLGVVHLVFLAIACGAVGAQEANDVGLVPETGLPRWMPRPSRYLDRPMTEAEYEYCRQRKDIPTWGPHGHPASDVPPAPRALLGEPVSVDVSGTVVDVLNAIMGQTNRLWLAGIRGASAERVTQLTVHDVPLWQALDKLLESYGYDWGFAHGAVLCWPALTPARPRPEVPEVAPNEEAAAEGSGPLLEISIPTPVEGVLDNFRPVRSEGPGGLNIVHTSRRVAVDVRLRDWKLVGHMAGGDPARSIQQVAAALPAVIDGPPLEGCISMGAHMWLD